MQFDIVDHDLNEYFKYLDRKEQADQDDDDDDDYYDDQIN